MTAIPTRTGRPTIPPYEAALRESVEQLVTQIEDAIRDPMEYIPSRIRFTAREVRAVLDYIERTERP